MTKAGAFLMGNKDITFMHDINLIHSKNKELINDILFNQKIKKCFENASYEFTVKTSIIASCEPLYRAKGKDKNANISVQCGVSESLLNLFDAVVNLDLGNNDEEINFQITHLIKFYTDKPPFGTFQKRGEQPVEDQNQGKKNKKEKDLLTEDDLRVYIEDCQKALVKISQKAYTTLICYLRTVEANYSTADLERMVRFVQAHAKLLGRSYATVYDVISVITLFEANEYKGTVDNAKEKILIKTLQEYSELENSIIAKLDMYNFAAANRR